jgi:hypothetical protein
VKARRAEWQHESTKYLFDRFIASRSGKREQTLYFLSDLLLHLPAQRLARPMKSDPDGFGGHLKNLSGFKRAQTFDFAQHEHSTEFCRKRIDR